MMWKSVVTDRQEAIIKQCVSRRLAELNDEIRRNPMGRGWPWWVAMFEMGETNLGLKETKQKGRKSERIPQLEINLLCPFKTIPASSSSTTKA
jgi:hypothetical protein